MSEKQYAVYQASDYESLASECIEPAAYAYIAGGAGHEKTLTANRLAFDRITLKQRAFADFTHGTTQTTLLGIPFRHPILLAPVAAQSLLHPDGEIATAQAAYALEAGMILSMRSSKPIQAVADALTSNKWFQLYYHPIRDTTLNIIQQVEAAGFEAIVLTLDAPVQSISARAQAANFQLPAHAQPASFASPKQANTLKFGDRNSVIFQGLMQDAPQLKEIAWLISQTTLPVVIKGAMAIEEIQQLIDIGVAGFVVSNHGGRALDCVPDSLSLLSAIRSNINTDVPLLFDGGIRSGYDIFKALAMGANAVCIGRLQAYALGVNGPHGVAHLLKLLRDELELCMALTGSPTIADIDKTRLFETHTP